MGDDIETDGDGSAHDGDGEGATNVGQKCPILS